MGKLIDVTGARTATKAFETEPGKLLLKIIDGPDINRGKVLSFTSNLVQPGINAVPEDKLPRLTNPRNLNERDAVNFSFMVSPKYMILGSIYGTRPNGTYATYNKTGMWKVIDVDTMQVHQAKTTHTMRGDWQTMEPITSSTVIPGGGSLYHFNIAGAVWTFNDTTNAVTFDQTNFNNKVCYHKKTIGGKIFQQVYDGTTQFVEIGNYDIAGVWTRDAAVTPVVTRHDKSWNVWLREGTPGDFVALEEITTGGNKYPWEWGNAKFTKIIHYKWDQVSSSIIRTEMGWDGNVAGSERAPERIQFGFHVQNNFWITVWPTSSWFQTFKMDFVTHKIKFTGAIDGGSGWKRPTPSDMLGTFKFIGTRINRRLWLIDSAVSGAPRSYNNEQVVFIRTNNPDTNVNSLNPDWSSLQNMPSLSNIWCIQPINGKQVVFVAWSGAMTRYDVVST